MIPVNEPLFLGNEKKYLCECIDTGWISSDGPFVKKFESEFAKYVGMNYGVAAANGTASLEMALYALEVKENDEIIMPSFTIISCALAAIRLGAKPVLTDIEPETWNIDVSQIEKKITSKTKGIMPVHIYGHPVDMDPIIKIAEKYNLKILEDAAEVHGAEYKNKKCGSFGEVSSFSFYANKIISCGEGGMVLCKNEKAAELARSYRNLCFKSEKRFWHTELGYNFRMSNLQAAVGLAQFEKIDEYIKIKRELGEYYISKLKDIQELKLQAEKEWAKTVYWMYAVELDSKLGISADIVMKKLKTAGVDTRPFFIGLHCQPVLREFGLFENESYPVTEKASKYGFYLPSGLALKKEQIDYVCDSLKKIIYQFKRGEI